MGERAGWRVQRLERVVVWRGEARLSRLWVVRADARVSRVEAASADLLDGESVDSRRVRVRSWWIRMRKDIGRMA